MRVIPALDLRRGRVVHATGGDRTSYTSIATRFPGLPDEPVALADRIRRRWGERPLYVADLDALEGGRPQERVLERLVSAGHDLRVDAAVRGAGRARALLRLGVERVVVALESLPAWSALREVADAIGTGRTGFSLDLRGGRPVVSRNAEDVAPEGPGDPIPALAARAARHGAGEVLVLELDRVGARSGPAMEPVRRCRRALPPRVPVVAGGGVRGAPDVTALAAAGCSACLAATALHGGELTPREVRELERVEAQSTRSTHRPD